MDAAAYAVHRQSLEAGRALHAEFKRSGTVGLGAHAFLQDLETVVQAAVIKASITVSFEQDVDAETITDDHFATLVFGEYDALRAALDAEAGETYEQLVAADKGAAFGDVEWWAVAVSAAGSLWAIGKMPWKQLWKGGKFSKATAVVLVAQVLAAIFAGLVGYQALTIKTEDGKNVWRQVGAESLEWLKYVAYAALGLAVAGGVVAIAVTASSARERRWAERVGPGPVDEGDQDAA